MTGWACEGWVSDTPEPYAQPLTAAPSARHGQAWDAPDQTGATLLLGAAAREHERVSTASTPSSAQRAVEPSPRPNLLKYQA